METIKYPVKGRKYDDFLTQEYFDLFYTTLENWRQDSGVVGGLCLHSCWGVCDVLEKRYQGETISNDGEYMSYYMTLYNKFKNPKFKIAANSCAAHILYLQDECGGFIHSTAEFEPTFDTRGCPIHFFNPIIALCEYYEWPYADEDIKSQIFPAIEKHWNWISKAIWQIGNGGVGRLDYPGWCGVTNQDLTVIHALALIGKVFGKWEWFNEFGKPALDHILSPATYYKEIGLFERGDGKNFAERLPYYDIIIIRLREINRLTGDERLPEIIDNIEKHFFDYIYVDDKGCTMIYRGAITDPVDKTKIYGFDTSSIPFNCYPGTIEFMEEYLERHPDEEKKKQVEALKETLAGYIFIEGLIPGAFKTEDPIFTVSSNMTLGFSNAIMKKLGDKLQEPKIVPTPKFHRQYKNAVWKQNGRLWSYEVDGVRKYGGFTRYPAGITLGPDEKPVWGDYADLENPDYLEIIED